MSFIDFSTNQQAETILLTLSLLIQKHRTYVDRMRPVRSLFILPRGPPCRVAKVVLIFTHVFQSNKFHTCPHARIMPWSVRTHG